MVQAGSGEQSGEREGGRDTAAAAAARLGRVRPGVMPASSHVRHVCRSHDRPAGARLPGNGDASLFTITAS